MGGRKQVAAALSTDSKKITVIRTPQLLETSEYNNTGWNFQSIFDNAEYPPLNTNTFSFPANFS